MPYPSAIARTALRSALRDHPQSAGILNGRRVNSMTVDEIGNALIALGLDPKAIAAAAIAGAPRVNLPQGSASVQIGQLEDDFDPYAHPWPQQGLEKPEDPPMIDPIETELQVIRSTVATGGFAALEDKLRTLISEAHKPPVEVIREVMVPCPAGTSVAPGVTAKPTGKTETWGQLFGVTGALGQQTTAIWDSAHPDTPRENTRYLWPHPQTEIALTMLHEGNNIMLYGPKGTGKTDWAQQLAAKTGRPFVLISCDSGTDSATLIGMTVPAVGGGVTWQDGQLTRGLRTPGAVICIDEPSVARSGALMVFQNVLQNRQLFISETGEKVQAARGVLFCCCDNTNGTGGGSRRGYTDTNRLNGAYLDRWAVAIDFCYMAPDAEADVLCGYTGCTRELATLLVSAATVTRAAADNETLSSGISFRRLIPWAQLLMRGISAEDAFRTAVLNFATEQDREAIREQCLLSYDAENVRRALNPGKPVPADPSLANPTQAGRQAAQDFAAYHRN